jgi:PAS domain S-box-containing protein
MRSGSTSTETAPAGERRREAPGPRPPQRRREDPLRDAEEQLSGILAITGDAIITADERQRIVLFNRGAEAIFGYTAAEAEGQPLEMLLPERFREAHREHVRRLAGGSAGARLPGDRARTRGLRRNGEEFPAEALMSRLDLEGGPIFTLVLSDVTERERAEVERAQLLQRERAARARAETAVERSRFLAEASVALADTLDYDATMDRVARLAVPTLADGCALYSVDDEGTVRRTALVHEQPATEALLAELLDPRGEAGLDAEVRRVARSGVPDLVPEVRAWRPDGERAPGCAEVLDALGVRSLILAPLRARGHTPGVLLALCTGVGRRYEADDLAFVEALASRAAVALDNAWLFRRAQDATHLRDEVLGIVSHDLRNPLNVISMSSALILDGGLPEASRRPAQAIQRMVVQMNDLIQDLLEVSRIEAGRLEVEPQPVATAELLQSVHDAWTPLAGARSISLAVEAEASPRVVLADTARVLQVFSNLIGNAVKFTPEGGRIVIGAEPDDGAVRFRVADTGTGIPARQLSRVFDRFWQARENRRDGAGLGLAIARGIVEAHGGRIWAESVEGEGSTFSFTLPLPESGTHTAHGGRTS